MANISPIGIQLISDFISNQRNKVVETFTDKAVKYSDTIKKHREIKTLSGDEERVRAYLLTRLVNELGYLPEHIELEKEYDIGRPKVNKPRIDVIVRDTVGNAFLYIELKSPDEFEKDKDEIIEKQLFNLASQEVGQGKKVKYLVLYSFDIDEETKTIRDKAVIIDYEAYTSFNERKEVRNFATELPIRYGEAQKPPYAKGGDKDLETDFSNEFINALGKNLHNVLRGGGGTDDNDIFSSLTNLILAKIQDESEKKTGEKYDFQTFYYPIQPKDKDRKREIIQQANEELFERINELYRRALKQKLNITDEKRLNKSFVIDENKFSLSKLQYAVSELERYSFVDGKNSINGKDILGDFFEGIVREGFKQSKGQFFTHTNIVRFLLWGLQLDKLAIKRVNQDGEIPYLIDPSAGSGTFLIEYMKFITENLKRRFSNKLDTSRKVKEKLEERFLPDYRENKRAKDYIYGIEINFNLGTATKVNMILHGDGSTNIFVKDGLLPFTYYDKETAPNALKNSETSPHYQNKAVNEEFDCIITNPPFSVDLDNDTKENIKDEFIFGDKKNSENLFIERYYQLLRENGRAGIVLPESVFDTTENKYIRLFIYKYFKVKAVVSLPQVAFEPYTSTKTSLLFLQKKTKAELEQRETSRGKFSNERSSLKTRCEKELELAEGKEMNTKRAIAKESEEQRKTNVQRMLKEYVNEEDEKLTLTELVQKYQDELTELCKYDKDTQDTFGFVNTWRVFGEVAKVLNYSIFMAEAEQIGYKRTKRGEKPQLNELYRAGNSGEILVDDGEKSTILDFLREIQWE